MPRFTPRIPAKLQRSRARHTALALVFFTSSLYLVFSRTKAPAPSRAVPIPLQTIDGNITAPSNAMPRDPQSHNASSPVHIYQMSQPPAPAPAPALAPPKRAVVSALSDASSDAAPEVLRLDAEPSALKRAAISKPDLSSSLTSRARNSSDYARTPFRLYHLHDERCAASVDTWERLFRNGGVADVRGVSVFEASGLDFTQPPVSLIGTDSVHRRHVSRREVAEFVTHLRVWRDLFHGEAREAVVVGGGVELEDGVLEGVGRCLREAEDGWQVLLFRHGGRVTRNDVAFYAMSKKGVEELLCNARAFVVSVDALFRAVVAGEGEKGHKTLEVRRCDVCRDGCASLSCEVEEDLEGVPSDRLPFHPPLHPFHAFVDKRRL